MSVTTAPANAIRLPLRGIAAVAVVVAAAVGLQLSGSFTFYRPIPLLLGQLSLGLINGAFYALLSLGLAVIFGMLNIINFAHGAVFMLGAFAAWGLATPNTWLGMIQPGLQVPDWLQLGYWPALVVAPLIVGAFGYLLEKTVISRLYKLDHLYGLLLTFGLALIFEGLARNAFGSSGMPYRIPAALSGPVDLGFMFMPRYRLWVVVAAGSMCLGTWLLIETGPRRRRRVGGVRWRAGGADLLGQSQHGVQLHHHGVCGRRHRRHGQHPGQHRHRVRAGHRRGTDQGLLPAVLGHGDLSGHGDRAAGPARRAVREGGVA